MTFKLSSKYFIRVIALMLLLCFLPMALSCSEEETAEMVEVADEAIDEEDPSQEEVEEDTQNDSNDEEEADSEEPTLENSPNDCPDTIGFVFEETNGILSIEFEDNEIPEGWVLKNDASDTSGDGYLQWEGPARMNAPGSGTLLFPIRITQTGTYRFLWKSSFRTGDNGTEHNDSWLRFPDADDFFGRKGDGSSIVYPKGSGKTPNPNGSSSDGWFKIYRSGNDNAFKWQASTSDNDAHNIYATFNNSGVYLIEISARSTFHGIDRLLLYQEDISQNDAIAAADTFSEKTSCN